MFQELLQQVVDQTEGAFAGILMGFDGIPVETYAAAAEGANVETVGAEYSAVLAQVKQASEMLELGTTNEVSVRAENMTTIIRLLNEEYFVAVTVAPSGNMGKARYLLRIQAPKLLENLV
ncbi:MAG: roadblock/LC7 domain-containing protein [Myxococcales bacterium]|nr:roadblock/LC7 domain-containing protein [Myxococcales bacterium]